MTLTINNGASADKAATEAANILNGASGASVKGASVKGASVKGASVKGASASGNGVKGASASGNGVKGASASGNGASVKGALTLDKGAAIIFRALKGASADAGADVVKRASASMIADMRKRASADKRLSAKYIDRRINNVRADMAKIMTDVVSKAYMADNGALVSVKLNEEVRLTDAGAVSLLKRITISADMWRKFDADARAVFAPCLSADDSMALNKADHNAWRAALVKGAALVKLAQDTINGAKIDGSAPRIKVS